MERPATSRAVAAPNGDGVTITLPPQGVRRFWRLWCGYVGVILCQTLLAGLLAAKTALAGGWPGRLLWGGALAAGVALLRFPTAKLTRIVFDFSLGQGTLKASRRRLSLSWRVWFHRSEQVWDAASIVALDEEAGTLCVLADGRLDRFFDGRDPGEIRWIAEVLRSALDVPASPPPLTAEAPVRYRLAGWSEPVGGFALIEPGQLCLRPRFRLDAVLVLRPAEERTFWSGGMPDGVAVERDDVAWGVGDGGQRVLRVWLYTRPGEAVALEISSPNVKELAAKLERFWAVP
jgi:hypothetical protein